MCALSARRLRAFHCFSRRMIERVTEEMHSKGAWIVQQPPWTMGKDLGYGLWKVLDYDRTDAEYSRELQVRGLGLQAR